MKTFEDYQEEMNPCYKNYEEFETIMTDQALINALKTELEELKVKNRNLLQQVASLKAQLAKQQETVQKISNKLYDPDYLPFEEEDH